MIFIKKGHRFSLQYHNGKDETLYVHKGNGFLQVEENDSKPYVTDFADRQSRKDYLGGRTFLREGEL